MLRTPSILLTICLFYQIILFGQAKPLDYYLPPTDYNSNITTPQEFLGYQIGEWHISHDQINAYCQILAKESDRVTYREYARSHEQRALFTLIISSELNTKNLEQLKKRHQNATSFDGALDLKNPLVIYQGYSIHGNESSGANAALLMAYHLAAGKSQDIHNLLNNSIVLIDPCMNPDGLQRFSTWVNMHKSQTLVSDPKDREYNEPWPKGRTNHYWSDLNRDWLLLTHPESRGRVKLFQEWRPHILTDHHEMGKNAGFFFQPGVPERTNPITPQINQTLTEEIGKFHARALDKIGASYFTKKRFDDYYYGKGSTYPDLQGCIGILFEQASSRGHYQENKNGILDFPYTIRNQVITSLSTQEAAISLIEKIKKYKINDIQEIKELAKKEKKQYYTFSRKKYREKADYFAHILNNHAIDVYFEVKKQKYIVPLYQRQYRLIKTIFERVNSFPSNEFYDVSSWTLPLAFQMEFEKERFRRLDNAWISFQNTPKLKYHHYHQSRSAKNHIIPWGQWNTTKVLNALLRDSIHIDMYIGDTITYPKFQLTQGDLILPTTDFLKIKKIIDRYPVHIYPISDSIKKEVTKNLSSPQIAMIIGNGTNSYDAGDIWFQIDQRMNLPLTKIEKSDLSYSNLERYTHIILPTGRHSAMSNKATKRIQKWVKNGGILICIGQSIQWGKSTGLLPEVRFEQLTNTLKSVENRIGGAIYQVNLSNDSPYARGYKENSLSVMKKRTWIMKDEKSSIFTYSKKPLLSGYSSFLNQNRIKKTSAMVKQNYGKGVCIGIVDNPLFRGYWIGGITLFENIIYMSDE